MSTRNLAGETWMLDAPPSRPGERAVGAAADRRALSDITVLDFTHMVSGPYAAMLMADLGARTIKIEPVGEGEGTRKLLSSDAQHSLHGMGAYFLTLNRNKKSICLNLKRKESRAVLHALVRQADVVIDNFAAGVTARLGIDHASLSKINPRIITCSITGFGQTGPAIHRPAFDMVAQGIGGGMSITGEEGGRPLRAGIPIGDLGGGLFGVIGVLSALHARKTTGVGQQVDISMLDCQISLLNYMATMHFLSGLNPEPLGNGHFVHVPYNTFRTRSRDIIIAVITDGFWASLVEALAIESLGNPDYRTQPGRFRDREIINSRIQEKLATESCEHWLDLLGIHRIPCAPVNDFGHALIDPQVRARNMVVEVAHPVSGTVRMPGNPVKLSDTHADIFSAPPLVGADTDEILGQLLKLDASEIARLRAVGAVG